MGTYDLHHSDKSPPPIKYAPSFSFPHTKLLIQLLNVMGQKL